MRSIKDIKKIVERNMELTIDSIKFIELEILFRLVERIGMMDATDKIYTILSRSDVIYEKNFSNNNYLIANAKVILKTMSHAKVYSDTVREYQMKNNRANALYIIEGKCLKRNPNMLPVYEDRIADYDALLNEREVRAISGKEKANSKDIYLVRTSTGNDVRIHYEQLEIKSDTYKIKHRKTGELVTSMEELMKSADKLDAIEGTNYRRKTLENNIYEVSTGKKIKAQEYKINGVVNMAGQVASGKTTFADALSVSLMDNGCRIVMILATVDAVIKKAQLLNKLDYDVCTLIGNYGREKHIDNQMRGMDYLPKYVSETLQQPCLLNAIINETTDVIKYGQEPCVSLKNAMEKDSKKTYVCQYFDICPRTLNERKIKSSDIVITTLEGFCYCTFGVQRENFLQYAIANFDLVIMDEVDSVVCSLDRVFAPMLALNDYLTKNSDYRTKYQTSGLKTKIESKKDEQEFILRLASFEYLMTSISSEINDYKTGWSKSDLKSFSAMSLLNKLDPNSKTEGVIPITIWNVFYELLKPQSIKRGNIKEVELLNIVERGDISISYMIEKIAEITVYRMKLKSEKIESKISEVKAEFEALDARILTKLLFILKIIAFEQLYRELSALVEGMLDVPIELREILNRNLHTQQKFMPNAPIGNTLAIEVRDDEMYIKKQFALGRALALRMPYLVLDDNGKALGANVLLMSGTGYMPGSARYHIGDKVDYVIEAEQAKRDYIANTRIVNLRSTTCVSGTKLELRNQNLKTLIEENEKKIIKCIKRDDKLLMIVNSYEQCKVAYKSIEKILRKYELDWEVWYLKSDSGEFAGNHFDNALQRRDITSFNGGILIAPACVIERGYNIVDIYGNAWFDTVMFLVRPMVDPNDYNIHVQKVNGYIMNHYTNLNYKNRIDVMEQMRKDAFEQYAKLGATKGSLSNLPEEMKTDVIASLFVVIEQVFGRLCRLGSNLKEKHPTIYWVDGAFNASEDGKFDTLKELESYLEKLMKHSHNPLVAKTLYEPFYKALKGEKS